MLCKRCGSPIDTSSGRDAPRECPNCGAPLRKRRPTLSMPAAPVATLQRSTESRSHLAPGTHIGGRFVIGERLDVFDEYAVYDATDADDDDGGERIRLVAFHIGEPSPDDEADVEAIVARTAHLDHPALAVPIAAGIEAGADIQPFVWYAEHGTGGLDLGRLARIRRKTGERFGNAAFKAIFDPLCISLDALHTVRPHGALSPRCVLVSAAGLRVVDLPLHELARWLDPEATPNADTAPEEIRTGGDPTVASDVFSLGQLLTVAFGPGCEWLDVSREAARYLATVLDRADSSEPSARPGAVIDIRTALAAALRDEVPTPSGVEPAVAEPDDAEDVRVQDTDLGLRRATVPDERDRLDDSDTGSSTEGESSKVAAPAEEASLSSALGEGLEEALEGALGGSGPSELDGGDDSEPEPAARGPVAEPHDQPISDAPVQADSQDTESSESPPPAPTDGPEPPTVRAASPPEDDESLFLEASDLGLDPISLDGPPGALDFTVESGDVAPDDSNRAASAELDDELTIDEGELEIDAGELEIDAGDLAPDTHASPEPKAAAEAPTDVGPVLDDMEPASDAEHAGNRADEHAATDADVDPVSTDDEPGETSDGPDPSDRSVPSDRSDRSDEEDVAPSFEELRVDEIDEGPPLRTFSAIDDEPSGLDGHRSGIWIAIFAVAFGALILWLVMGGEDETTDETSDGAGTATASAEDAGEPSAEDDQPDRDRASAATQEDRDDTDEAGSVSESDTASADASNGAVSGTAGTATPTPGNGGTPGGDPSDDGAAAAAGASEDDRAGDDPDADTDDDETTADRDTGSANGDETGGGRNDEEDDRTDGEASNDETSSGDDEDSADEDDDEPDRTAAAEPECPSGMRFVQTGSGAADGVCIDRYEFPGKGLKPRTRIDAAGARRICESTGKRLCTASEWRRACGSGFPYRGDFDADRCNTATADGTPGQRRKAGSARRCRSRSGAYDMSGNVAEWVAEGKAMGGSFADAGDDASCRASSSSPPADEVGFRCCVEPFAQ